MNERRRILTDPQLESEALVVFQGRMKALFFDQELDSLKMKIQRHRDWLEKAEFELCQALTRPTVVRIDGDEWLFSSRWNSAADAPTLDIGFFRRVN